MGSSTRWLITSYQHSWVGTTKKLVITTDVAVHMYCRHTHVLPKYHKRTSFKRGLIWKEEPDWCFVEYWDIEQEEPGDTLTHTILIPDWVACMTRWWYFWATESGVPAISNTAIFSQHFEGIVGPPAFGPVTIPILNPLIRCGNHYVAWDFARYYVLICTSTRLSVWVIVDDIPYRLDNLNEPTAAPAQFRDADMRLDSVNHLLHIAAYRDYNSPANDQIRYYTFNLNTEQWQDNEFVSAAAASISSHRNVCITLDSTQQPTVVYVDKSGYVNRVFGRQRVAGVWGARQQLISAYPRSAWAISLWTNPPADLMHVIAVDSSGNIRYNTWLPPAGPGVHTIIATGAGALLLHSIMPTAGVPHVGIFSRYLKLRHYWGTPPDTRDAGLHEYDGSFACMISTQAPPNLWGIVFRDEDGYPAWLFHPEGGPWNDLIIIQDTTIMYLSAMLHEDVTVSALWRVAATAQAQVKAWPLIP